ncbi:MAG: hypothetical protein ACRDY7_13925 [Acidimicrobiia bacterium]
MLDTGAGTQVNDLLSMVTTADLDVVGGLLGGLGDPAEGPLAAVLGTLSGDGFAALDDVLGLVPGPALQPLADLLGLLPV